MLRIGHAKTFAFLVIAALAAPIALGACVAANEPGASEGDGPPTSEALSGNLPVGTQLQTTTALNLRAGASTSNQVLDVIPSGATVTLAASAPSNGFYNVTYDGTTGWSSGQYLVPAPMTNPDPPPDPDAGTTSGTMITTGNVNLRSSPSLSASVEEVIPIDTIVTLLAAAPSNGFYNVSYNGAAGWTSQNYLATTSSANTQVAGGFAFTFRPQTLALSVGVFVSSAAMSASEVSVVVYGHGLNVCTPVAKNPPMDFITAAPFDFADVTAAAKKPVVFVVPFLDWEHLSANGMAISGTTHHKLGIPQNFNGVVAEVLQQIGDRQSTAAPTIDELIVSGHSRAYDFIDPLADAYSDPQMSTGALSHLSRVWAFDTSYVCDSSNWTHWLNAKPNMSITMFYRPGTDTASCGQSFASAAAPFGARFSVKTASEAHCSVPDTRLPPLLSALP